MAGHDRLTPEGKAFFKQLEELSKLQTRVGFQRGTAADEDGADMADVAMWNELGTEHSPSRPFMRQSVDNNASKVTAMCGHQLRALAQGKTTAKEALQQIGVMQKALVQAEITNGSFAPNAPYTVAKKGSSKPLIDTGRMRASVTVEVTEKGGD